MTSKDTWFGWDANVPPRPQHGRDQMSPAKPTASASDLMGDLIAMYENAVARARSEAVQDDLLKALMRMMAQPVCSVMEMTPRQRAELWAAHEAARAAIAQAEKDRDADRLAAAAPDLLACQTMGAMSTPDFLDWVVNRIVNVYGENPDVDFLHSLRNRARAGRAAIAKAKGDAT